nr:hypothetical protein [Brevundimonas vesicularis]
MTIKITRRAYGPLLLATTALATAAFAVSARAQEAAQAAEVDEIVVTGQREAQRAAIAVKRAEFEVMDAVSADDIGKLPDHNTAAALRRIPGVSVMEDQGEPRGRSCGAWPRPITARPSTAPSSVRWTRARAPCRWISCPRSWPAGWRSSRR